MCPVNPLAPGMVGPGTVIDKKMRKKMKKAHKKMHKKHRHGKVGVLWVWLGKASGTAGAQDLWAWEMAITLFWQMTFPLCKGILLRGI